MSFSVKINGINKIVKLLNKVARGQKGFVAKEIGIYLLGDNSRGLKHYAPYRHITRRRAYGVAFFNDNQRRAFFGKLKSGEISIPYHRTGKQGAAWGIAGRSTGVRIVNKDPSTTYTRGQTRLHAKMGWQTTKETIRSNMAGALRRGKAVFNQWLRSLK